MRSLKVEMLHAKKSETINFGILPRGGVVLRLCELLQSRFKGTFFLENITPGLTHLARTCSNC